jgi:hypothetical protein
MTRGLLVIWRALPTIVPCSAHKLPDLDIHQLPRLSFLAWASARVGYVY